MSLLEFIFAILFSFGATVGTAIVFNTSKYDIVWAALTGSVGWLLYSFVYKYSGSMAIGYLIGAFGVSLMAEVLAAIIKNPATVYLLPGLLPLVPGGGMFETMKAVVSGDMESALGLGFSTLSFAGAIAIGIALASSAARIRTFIHIQHLRKIGKDPEALQAAREAKLALKKKMRKDPITEANINDLNQMPPME